MFIWDYLKNQDCKYLATRNFNQDPLENLFGQIRQHGICNTNPTPFQFVAALKTTVINNFTGTLKGSNCESDDCQSLDLLTRFIQQHDNISNEAETQYDVHPVNENLPNTSCSNQATAYVAGYLLKNIKLMDCRECQNNLFCNLKSSEHNFTYFKEYNECKENLLYANEKVIDFIERINARLFDFLNKNGHSDKLEIRFLEICEDFLQNYRFCNTHTTINSEIFKKCVKLSIYKFCKEHTLSTTGKMSSGHAKKMKKFKAL